MENAKQQIGVTDLLELAARLRQSATETEDESYVVLFLSAALALEAREFGLPIGQAGMRTGSDTLQ